MSKLEVYDIWAEDLFKWFTEAIISWGGDGDGLIMCENYKEVADWYEAWQKSEYAWSLSDKYEKDNSILLKFHHGWLEFSNQQQPVYGYTWIIKEDCVFGQDYNENRKILPSKD